MTITAKIIADSISEHGIRLTTMQLRYPRFIHAEILTHRALSRSSSSSRAIPVERMVADIGADPAFFVELGVNQPGMQAGAQLNEADAAQFRKEWNELAVHVGARVLDWKNRFNLHKQILNRAQEAWQHINVVVTATDWDNFFSLRCHPDAQPEIQELAREMHRVREKSQPDLLREGEWHTPYVTGDDEVEAWERASSESEAMSLLCRVSAARCARVSYNRHDGQRPSVEEDLKLFERLAGSQPIHASPLEHVGTPDVMTRRNESLMEWVNPHLHGNLRGWQQFRKMIPGNTVEKYQPEAR